MRLDSYADEKLRLNVYALDDEMEGKLVYSTVRPLTPPLVPGNPKR
jgi:hypothetical protein